MSDHDSIDWVRVVVHFLIGAVVGAAAGFLLWGPDGSVAMPVAACALSIGVLGAVFGDRFWHWFLDFVRWW